MKNHSKTLLTIMMASFLSSYGYSEETGNAVAGTALDLNAAGGIQEVSESSVGESADTSIELAADTSSKSLEEQAKDALAQKQDDVSQQKNLEEVFEQAEERYSSLKQGSFSFNYGFSYGYTRSDRLTTVAGQDGNAQQVVVRPNANHSFGNSLSMSYGLLKNVSLSASLPFSYRLNNLTGLDKAGIGDMSFSLRWQPFPVRAGAPNTSLFLSISPPTGDSPFEIDPNRDLSTGKGYTSFSAGVSASKYIDPAIIFTSFTYGFGTSVTDIDQVGNDALDGQTNRVLRELTPGDSLGLSIGMAYSITYDLSLSLSTQLSYGLSSRYKFDQVIDGDAREITVFSGDSMNATFGSSIGYRVSPTKVVNFNFGFGLTEDTPDVTMGVSMPLDFSGLK